MQEHEYKARDKTVQKMSRDGLREENLRSKTEKRITGREADGRKVAGHREQELDFGKARKAHISDDRIEKVAEVKQRWQSRRDFLEQEDISESEEMETSEISDLRAGEEKSSPVSRSRLRKDSIRGHPGRKVEADSEIVEPDKAGRKKWSQHMQQKSRNATMKNQKLMKNQWKTFGKKLRVRQRENRF